MKAYAWASRLIEFGRKTPLGAIQICDGPAKDVRDTVSALATHGQGMSDGKLLVPIPAKDIINGVPFGVDHISAFSDRVMCSLSRQKTPAPKSKASPHSWLAH